MARKIIIVTENGRNYNRDGELFITNMMKDQYGVAAKTYFFSGPEFCRKGTIAKAIVPPNDDIFVIWAKESTDIEKGLLKIFPPESLEDLSKDLMRPEFEDKTAWEILKLLCKE